eukprot:3386542-Amphidinium_carterae.2
MAEVIVEEGDPQREAPSVLLPVNTRQAYDPPLVCSVCWMAFNTRDELMVHQRDSHPAWFRCRCGRQFASELALKAHCSSNTQYPYCATT